MNNKELYKETFSKLHASRQLDLEEMKMRNKSRHFRCSKKLIVVIAVLVMLMAMTCIANAATGGELIQNFKILINGESLDASAVQQEDGSFEVELKAGDHFNIETEDEGIESNGSVEKGSGTLKINKDGEETSTTYIIKSVD